MGTADRNLDALVRRVCRLDRQGLTHELRSLGERLRMDFTEDALRQMSLERLRHLVLAAAMHVSERHG